MIPGVTLNFVMQWTPSTIGTNNCQSDWAHAHGTNVYALSNTKLGYYTYTAVLSQP